MITPTDAQIDAAIPVNGTPNRALTNALLRNLALALRQAETQVLRVLNPAESQVIDLSTTPTNAMVVIEPSSVVGRLRLQLPNLENQWVGQRLQFCAKAQVVNFDIVAPATVIRYNALINQTFQFGLQNTGPNEWALLSQT